jgi:hypothetical protein
MNSLKRKVGNYIEKKQLNNMSQLNSSLGNSYKLIPIDSVLQDVYRVVDTNSPEVMSETDILESASKAAHQLYNHKYYEEAICLAAVNVHRVTLPDYRKIKAVFWKPDMTEDETHEFIETLTVDKTTSENVITAKTAYSTKMSPTTVNRWTLAYPKHGISALMDMNAHPDHKMGPNCNITYSIKGCVMTVSKEDGYVVVLYDRIVRDENGSMLVPFIPEVADAIRSHVLMEMHMRQMNSHRSGSINLYRIFKDEWTMQQAEVRAKLLMLDLPEWISMINETDKLVKGNDPLERHINEHNGPEYMNLGNFLGIGNRATY